MNNEDDRERSGDGAGPVANDDGAGPCKPFLISLLLLAMSLSVSATKVDTGFSSSSPHSSQCALARLSLLPLSTINDVSGIHLPLRATNIGKEGLYAVSHARRRRRDSFQTGLSLSLGAGVMRASDATANFYNGQESNVNNVYRILHSNGYGYQIWNDLNTQNLIDGTAITKPAQLRVAEYGNMHYRLGVQLHVGFRYDYDGGWGWLVDFDYCKLSARGVFLIDATNGIGLPTLENRYVTCPIVGQEKRIFVNLGLSKRFRMHHGGDIGLEGGINVNNVKVVSNDMQIAGSTYSILDVWGGQSPDIYTQAYDYINQGGIGAGGFLTADYSFTLPNLTALTLGYTCYYTTINLQGWRNQAFQNLLFLRVDINNFDFFQ